MTTNTQPAALIVVSCPVHPEFVEAPDLASHDAYVRMAVEDGTFRCCDESVVDPDDLSVV